jgi:phenylalanyl-tRNA synthetase beta subunit
MTPKEKAKALVKNYISICERWNIDYVNSKTIEELKKELFQLQWFIPKQCALIAVDEIINSVGDEHVSDIFNEYWDEVKQEIELL